MSGDVQPRKRKEKKRRRDDEDTPKVVQSASPQQQPKASRSASVVEDIEMHEQHDHGTGGHWCAKILFFSLMAILVGLVGLIVLENRGNSDLDTPLSESRFADYLEGWVDEVRVDEHHDDHSLLESLHELDEHDHDDEPFSEEELSEDEDEEHDDEHDHGDEDAHDDDVDDHADYNDDADNDDADNDEHDENEDGEDASEELVVGASDEDVAADDDDNDDDDIDVNEEKFAKEVDESADNDDNDGNEAEDDNDDDTNENDNDSAVADDDNGDKSTYASEAAVDDGDEDDREPFDEEEDDDDDDEEQSFEQVIDNDSGEDLHLQKLAQKDVAASAAVSDDDEPAEKSSAKTSSGGAQTIYSDELAEELRKANEMLEDQPASALKRFDRLLELRPLDALYGRAKALDLLAERRKDNALLDQSIAAYTALIAGHAAALTDERLLAYGTRCVQLMRFKGDNLKAVPVHEKLIARFNNTAEQRNQLAITLLLVNRMADAKLVLHETLLRWRTDGFAAAHYGFVLKSHDNDLAAAVLFLREGIESGANGTDDGRLYFALGDALQRLHRNDEARDVFRRGADRGLFRSEYQRSLYNVQRLSAQPIWSVAETGSVAAAHFAKLSQNWLAIRAEAELLLDPIGSHFTPEAENLRDRGDWRQFELFARGRRVDANCARAPFTCKIIDGFAAARTCTRGQVKFSVMQPGTHVWPHCGPTNCRLRAHLGLHVPRRTFLRVANKWRTWRESEWLIFDDSFEHEVWHNGTSSRLVLIVDIWHPELTEHERASLVPI